MRAEPGEAPRDAARVVLITAPDDGTPRRLARAMVERRLAACVNLLSGVTSVYRWQREVEEEPEVLLVVKTRASRLDALQRFLDAEHPYDVPELVALDPVHVAEGYLRWLLDSTAPADDGAEE